jgi:hypothetical protein
MMMKDQMKAIPALSVRAHVEMWLKDVAREAGEYAENMVAEFGAKLEENGDVSVAHLSDAEVQAIMQAALEA